MSDTIISAPAQTTEPGSIFVDTGFDLGLEMNSDIEKHPKEQLMFSAWRGKRLGSQATPNASILCVEHYMTPNVSVTKLILGPRVKEHLIKDGVYKTDPLLELESYDGSRLKTLQHIVVKDILNCEHNASYYIYEAIKKMSDLPQHLGNFLKLLDNIEDNITDIQLISGDIYASSDRSLNHSNYRNFCILNVFIGDEYLLTYNNMPSKKIVSSEVASFNTHNRILVTRRSGKGCYTNTIPITTILKKTPEEIKRLMLLKGLNIYSLTQDNNLSDNAHLVSNLKTLAAVA